MRPGIAVGRSCLALLATTALVLALMHWPSPACADFTSATLLSGTDQQQFEEASEPALSEDGRYVAFTGRLAGVAGIYRRDLQNGEIEPVAVESGFEGGPGQAKAPSISADGRYVAFTSIADLDPAAEPSADVGCPEVYVRDMQVQPGEAGAYTLASALNGSEEGITFAGCPSGGGAQSAPGVALSADGRHVAFTVLSPSNLGGSCTSASSPACTTAPSQVAVRDLEVTKPPTEAPTTTLVTATPDGIPTPGGGAYPSAEMESHAGVSASGSTAAISADASTVAWLGSDVAAQVSPGPGEGEVQMPIPGGSEVEPLWRRIADGAGAFTRRLLGGADLNLFFPNLKEGGFVLGGSLVDYGSALPANLAAPALSEDGQTVAVLSNAPPSAGEASALLEASVNAPDTDAYVVHVDDDPATAPQVTALTATPDYVPTRAPTTGDIEDIAISPDGSRVAFDTNRTQFALPALTLISPPATFAEVSETYEANLRTGTLQRVTSTYDGAEPNDSAGGLSCSGDGQELAFASQASNLFYGDALPRASEVYLAEEAPTSGQAATEEIGPNPAPKAPTPEWQLSAIATARSDGDVSIAVEVPGAGRLAAQATAQLPAAAADSAAHAGRGRVAHAKGRRGAGSKHGSAVRSARVRGAVHGRTAAARSSAASTGVALLTRAIARAAAVSTGPSEVGLLMHADAAYHTLLTGADGLYAVVRVTFTAPGHSTLATEIPVTFRLLLAGVSAHKRTTGARKARRGAAHRARARKRPGAAR
jgi:hypothetical protein